jgi:hypothetical protein
VPVNFWLTKEKLTPGVDGEEGWKGLLLFNADRRTAERFDPATDNLSLSVGNSTLSFPAGSLKGTSALMRFATPFGQVPAELVKLSLSKQSLRWKFSQESLAATFPGLQAVALTLGSNSYRTTVLFDENGRAKALDSVRPCFIVAKGTLGVRPTRPDSANLKMLLSNGSFLYETGDALRIRLLEGATVLVDRDFTALGVGEQTTNDDGAVAFTVQTLPDTATTNRIAKFSYKSGKGKLALEMAQLNLDALTTGEAHVTVEVTIRDRIYTTGVTFFGPSAGTYSTLIP